MVIPRAESRQFGDLKRGIGEAAYFLNRCRRLDIMAGVKHRANDVVHHALDEIEAES